MATVNPGFFPRDDLAEETLAGLGFDLETFLGDEGIVGISAMVREALGIPGELGGSVGEEGGGFVEIAQAKVQGAARG